MMYEIMKKMIYINFNVVWITQFKAFFRIFKGSGKKYVPGLFMWLNQCQQINISYLFLLFVVTLNLIKPT